MIKFLKEAELIDRIQKLKINGKTIAKYVFQIPTLNKHYSNFKVLQLDLGINTIPDHGLLKTPSEIRCNQEFLLLAYKNIDIKYLKIIKNLKKAAYLVVLIEIIFIASCMFFDKIILLGIISTILIIILLYILWYLEQLKDQPIKLFKKSLNNEVIFCYLYSQNAITIEKGWFGLDIGSDRISFNKSDISNQIFEVNNKMEIMPFLKGNKWGYKKDGKVIIDFKFDFDSNYCLDMRFGENELALVFKNGKYGYINKIGEAKIPFQYLYGAPFENGWAIVKGINNKSGLIDINNDLIFDLKYDDITLFNKSLYKVGINGLFGIINVNGETILPIEYSEIGELDNEFATIEIYKNNKTMWGFINSRGNIAIDPQFELAFNFNYELAVVKELEGDNGVINTEGKIIIPFEYENISIHKSIGLQPFIFGNKTWGNWGIIDTLTKEFSEFDCGSEDEIIEECKELLFQDEDSDLESFSDQDKWPFKWGFKDKDHNIIIPPIYENHWYLKNKYHTRVMLNGKWGIIDNKGDVIVDFVYDNLGVIDDGQIIAFRNDKYFYLDPFGKELAEL